jgi:schlafen family protein
MEMLTRLGGALDERRPDYAYALVSLVSRLGDSEVEFLRGRVEFFRSRPTQADTSVQIGPILLERKTRPGAEIVEVLKGMVGYVGTELRQTGQPWSNDFGGFRARPTVSNIGEPGWLYHTRVELPNAIGEPRFCDWPSIQAWASPPSANTSIDLAGPIVDSEAGIVSDPFQFIDEFLGANLRGWPGQHRGLWLVLPDFRARFSSVELDGGSIRAQFELGTISPEGVRFMMNVDGHAASGSILPLENQPVLVALLPRTANSVQLLIMDRQRKSPIDWVNLTSNPWYAAPEVRYTYSAGQVAWLVSRGESETLEFKEFPSEKAARKRHHEDLRRIVETVVAFANTGGGIILVGVSDEGGGTGVDVPSARHVIEQSMRELTDPLIQVEFDASELDGQAVLVVKVTQGHGRPYTSKTSGAVHVRVGASNFRARSEEIRRLCGGPR